MRADFLFVKLFIVWFNSYTSINLLLKLSLFMELVACWFHLWNLLCVEFFVSETYYMLIFPFLKLVHWFFLFMKLVLFLKHVVCCFSFVGRTIRKNPASSDFFSGICCLLIFFSLNLLQVDFSLRETYTLIFLFVKLILLLENITCWFLSVELFVGLFLFVKLVACCFSTSWNLHTDLSPRETGFIHETCCLLIFVFGTNNKQERSKFKIFFWNFLLADFLFVKLVTGWILSS